MKKYFSITLVIVLLIQFPFLRALADDVQQEIEPNDNPETATQLQPGSVTGSVGTVGDSEDWFIAFNEPGPDHSGTVSLYIEYDQPSCVIDYGISWDDAMIETTEGKDDKYLFVDFAPPVFYIRVFATEGSGSYTLQYNQVSTYNDYGVCMPFGCF